MATKMSINSQIKTLNVDLAVSFGTAKNAEDIYQHMKPKNVTVDETYESLKDSRLFVVFDKGTYPIKTYKQYPDGSYKFQIDQRFEYKLMLPQRNDTTYEISPESAKFVEFVEEN